MLRDVNVSPDSGRSWDAPSRSSRCAGAAAAGRGRPVSPAPGPGPPAPLPRPPRAPPGTPSPAPRAPPAAAAAAAQRPRGGRAAAGRGGPPPPLPPSRPPHGSAPATTKRGELSPAPRAAAPPPPPPTPPPPPPSPTPASGERRPGPRRAPPYLSRLLTGSIFQEPGDEEVELCAGERDGETHRLSGRAAGGGGPRAESPGASGPGSPPTYPIAAPRGLSSHKTCLWVTSGPPAGHPAAEGKRGWCRRLPYSCHCVFTSRASAPPFKQRRRRRRRRRRKQQLSGSGYRRRRRLRRGSLRRRKESAAFAAPGSACPRPAPAPPPPPPAQKKECLRPRGPGAPAAGAARPPPAAPRPKVRFIYLFPVEDVGAGAAGWLEGAFSVEADLGREGAGDGSAEGSDAHGAAAQALFSGAGWG